MVGRNDRFSLGFNLYINSPICIDRGETHTPHDFNRIYQYMMGHIEAIHEMQSIITDRFGADRILLRVD